MTEARIVEGIAPGSDHYVPRFAVYLGPAEEAGAAGARLVSKVDATWRGEMERIRKRTSSASANDPSSMAPLAGPWGEPRGAKTNDVVSVTFTQSLEQLAQVRVTLLNVYDSRAQRFRYSDVRGDDGPIVEYGKTLALLVGYRDKLTPVFEGLVTTIEAQYPESGEAVLELTAVDKRERLRNKKLARPESFGPITEEQLAAELFGKVGLQVAAPAEQQTDAGIVRIRADQDLLQYVVQRAEEAPLELIALGDTVFARRPADVTPPEVIRYAYRRGLLSFTPTLSSAGLATRVRVVARIARTGERIEVTSDLQGLQDRGLAPRSALVLALVERDGQSGARDEVVTNLPAESREMAQKLADAMLKRNLDRMLTATGEVLGDPRLAPGVTVRVEGVGRYSGDYYVTEVTHSLGDMGYRTQFSARRNASFAQEGSTDADG